jgi:hypothetical protein
MTSSEVIERQWQVVVRLESGWTSRTVVRESDLRRVLEHIPETRYGQPVAGVAVIRIGNKVTCPSTDFEHHWSGGLDAATCEECGLQDWYAVEPPL